MIEPPGQQGQLEAAGPSRWPEFTLGKWSLRKGSTKSRRTQKIFTAAWRKIQDRKIQLARIQLELGESLAVGFI